MNRPHVTPAATAVVLVLALAACQLPLREVGRAPEGRVRERETPEGRAAKARMEEARHARLDAAETRQMAPVAGSASADARRTGVTATQRYHAPGCPDLAGADEGGRVEFASCWAAIDANFTPCPKCRPGP